MHIIQNDRKYSSIIELITYVFCIVSFKLQKCIVHVPKTYGISNELLSRELYTCLFSLLNNTTCYKTYWS